MRVRSILVLLALVLAIAAPAVAADLFEVTMTAFRDGLRHAFGG